MEGLSNIPALVAPTLTDGSLALSPTKPNQKVKSVQPESGKETCTVYGIKHNTEIDQEYAELNGPTWLGFSTKACNCWVHAGCYGFKNAPVIVLHLSKRMNERRFVSEYHLKLYLVSF